MEKEELLTKIKAQTIKPSEIDASYLEDLDVIIICFNVFGSSFKEYLPKKVFDDASYLEQIISSTTIELDEYIEKYPDNLSIILASVKKRGLTLKYASARLQNDKAVVLEAVKNNWESLQYASATLQNDLEIAEIYIKNNNYSNLNHLGPQIKENKNFLLPYIKINGCLLKQVSPTLKEDQDIVKSAMQSNIDSLKYASPNLRSNCEFMLELISINENALKYVNKDLLSDPIFMVRSINSYQLTLF